MIEPQTYKEQDREFTLKALKAVRHVILVMNEVYRDFWNRDPQQIVETMNANVALYLERFESNTALGITLNDRAAAAGLTDRMHITMPEGYSFDSATNTFNYTAPVVIVPEQEVIEEIVIPNPEPEVIVEEPDDEIA